MKLAAAMDIHASAGFKGRKPGGIKSNNPDKVLKRAKEMWGDGVDFDLELSRAIKSECPHMKAMSYGGLTRTQKYSVAKRMHGMAQTRIRATRLKSKKKAGYVTAGGPGSGRRPEGKTTKEDIKKVYQQHVTQKTRYAKRPAMR